MWDSGAEWFGFGVDRFLKCYRSLHDGIHILFGKELAAVVELTDIGVAEVGNDRLSHDPVSLFIWVDAVALHGKFLIFGFFCSDFLRHECVKVCNEPSAVRLLRHPFGVSRKHGVVIKSMLVMVIEDGWGDVQDLGAVLLSRSAQAQVAILKTRRSLRIERLIDAALEKGLLKETS